MNKKELTKLISAMVIGDGYLGKSQRGINARYVFNQIAIHKDYVDWQANILTTLTYVNIRYKDGWQDADGTQHQSRYTVETRSHPVYTTIYDRTYFDGRKSVSTHDLELFDWQSAAIWFMDDGYRLKSRYTYDNGNVFYSTDNYTHAEVILLQKVLYNKLNIPFNIRRKGYKKDGTIVYRLVATKDNAERFIEGIAPFILPSFEYKLSSERKLSTIYVDNEIV